MVRTHPSPPLRLPRSQVVRHKTFTLAFASSNLAEATKILYDPLAQSVEHLTFNQGVWSSNLQRVTKFKCLSGGIGRRTGLKILRVLKLVPVQVRPEAPIYMEEYPSLVEGIGLENRQIGKPVQGFESLFLRQILFYYRGMVAVW